MHHIEPVCHTSKLKRQNDSLVKEEIDLSGDIPAEEVLPELKDDTLRPTIILRAVRHRKNFTQKELAKKLGIRQHHLSEMENAKRPIGKNMAKKLGEVLCVDWHKFL